MKVQFHIRDFLDGLMVKGLKTNYNKGASGFNNVFVKTQEIRRSLQMIYF